MAQTYPEPTKFIATQQPMVVGDPFRSMTNEWNSGLCSCCDNVSQCLYAYFCYPCFLRGLTRKLDESICSCLCVPNALAAYRMKVRTAYKIKGDSCSDFLVVGCCGFCAAMQIDNELRAHGIH